MVVLQRLIARYGRDIVIIHGGEAGVDESFNRACKSLGIAVEARLANWPQTGPPMLWSKNRAASRCQTLCGFAVSDIVFCGFAVSDIVFCFRLDSRRAVA
jgi:hypothetical protein